jgi:hypothetical protein
MIHGDRLANEGVSLAEKRLCRAEFRIGNGVYFGR